MTTAAARRRRRRKHNPYGSGTGVLRGNPVSKSEPLGPTTGVLRGHPLPPKKKPRKPQPDGGSGGGSNSGSGGGSRTPPPKAPTKTNAYQPNPTLAQSTTADLTRLHDSMSQDDFAAAMHTYGGTGSPDGNGYLGQQTEDGAGQMAWPGSGGSAPHPSTQPTSAPPTLGSPETWHPQDGMNIVAPTQTNVGTGLQSFGSSAPTPGSTTGAFHPAVSAGPGGTQQAAGSGGGDNTGQQSQNAQMLLQSTLDSWGLGSLGGVVLDYLRQGYDATSIQYLLTQTPEYKRRFSGNDARIKGGLGALSPAEYLATERSYQDVLRSAGMPAGFYDSPDDFTSWIANDTSPTEVAHRVDDAVKFAQSTDPTYRTALQAYFGIDTAHIAAYFLDPQRAMPLLTKQANASSIGAAALNQGLMITNLQDAFRYTDQGVTEQAARDAYGQIADFLPTEKVLGQRYGLDYNQHDAEQELLGGMASSARKRRSLNQSEEALFAGSGGQSQYSLGGTDTSSY